MGSSGSNEKIDNYLKSVLISFIKIKDFESIFKDKKEGKLFNIFASFIENIENNYKINAIINQFKQIKDPKRGSIKNLPFNEMLEYIIETLHIELNERKEEEEEEEEEKNKETYHSFQQYTDNFNKYNNSIIQKLFFGFYNYDVVCKKCDNKILNFDHFYIKSFDLSSEEQTKIIDLITNNKEEIKIKKIKCPSCEKSYDYDITNHNNAEFPFILVMYFNKKENYTIEEHLIIGGETYNLICFIAEVDEKNNKTEKYNVFYLNNQNWYIFDVDKMEYKKIHYFNRIIDNPIVVFYQKDKTLFEDIYYNLNLILDDIENNKELVNDSILDDKYDKYYIVNRQYINQILKIFESDDNYPKNDYEIKSINDLDYIFKLNIIEYIEKYKKVVKRIKNIEEELFIPKMSEAKLMNQKEEEKKKSINRQIKEEKEKKIREKNEEEIKNIISYPTDFILIKQNILDALFDILKLCKDYLEKCLYEVMFGETYAFIKHKNDNKTIFACSYEEKSFEVETILKYDKEECFSNEIKNYISNKRGLEYYYQKRKLKISEKKMQIIKDDNSGSIGFLLNIKDNNHLNINKYDEKTIDKINIKNSIYNESNSNNMIFIII